MAGVCTRFGRDPPRTGPGAEPESSWATGELQGRGGAQGARLRARDEASRPGTLPGADRGENRGDMGLPLHLEIFSLFFEENQDFHRGAAGGEPAREALSPGYPLARVSPEASRKFHTGERAAGPGARGPPTLRNIFAFSLENSRSASPGKVDLSGARGSAGGPPRVPGDPPGDSVRKNFFSKRTRIFTQASAEASPAERHSRLDT